MENKDKKIGIKIEGGSNIQVERNRLEGFDTAIDAKNTKNLKMKDNEAYKSKSYLPQEKRWYRNPAILIQVILGFLQVIIQVLAIWLR